jgi:glycosyltransferase involved in cell wall biosynthesis
METTPLVSIGLPVRNGERWIERAIDSLVAQTETRVEILVSDNCSTDATATIARRRAADDDRISVLTLDENIGMMENFEHVLGRARGEFFMWAAADDVWEPDFVASLVGALQREPGAGVAMSAIRRTTESGESVDLLRFDDVARWGWLRRAMAAAGRNAVHLWIYGLYRTATLRAIALPFPHVAAGDRIFAVKLALSTDLAYVDRPLYGKQVADRHVAERYADERLGQQWSQRRWVVGTGWRLVREIAAAPTVPATRRLAAPLLGAQFVQARTIPRLRELAFRTWSRLRGRPVA